MKPKFLLRIAAILIIVHSGLHTLGFSGWKQAPDPVEHGVIQQMTGHAFPFMGASHSLADYYDGFGYACSIALFLIGAILLIIASDLSSDTALAKKIIIALSIALLFWGIDELIFFFPFAAGLTLIACVCCFWSFHLMNSNKLTAV